MFDSQSQFYDLIDINTQQLYCKLQRKGQVINFEKGRDEISSENLNSKVN